MIFDRGYIARRNAVEEYNRRYELHTIIIEKLIDCLKLINCRQKKTRPFQDHFAEKQALHLRIFVCFFRIVARATYTDISSGNGAITITNFARHRTNRRAGGKRRESTVSYV